MIMLPFYFIINADSHLHLKNLVHNNKTDYKSIVKKTSILFTPQSVCEHTSGNKHHKAFICYFFFPQPPRSKNWPTCQRDFLPTKTHNLTKQKFATLKQSE